MKKRNFFLFLCGILFFVNRSIYAMQQEGKELSQESKQPGQSMWIGFVNFFLSERSQLLRDLKNGNTSDVSKLNSKIRETLKDELALSLGSNFKFLSKLILICKQENIEINENILKEILTKIQEEKQRSEELERVADGRVILGIRARDCRSGAPKISTTSVALDGWKKQRESSYRFLFLKSLADSLRETQSPDKKDQSDCGFLGEDVKPFLNLEKYSDALLEGEVPFFLTLKLELGHVKKRAT